MTKTRLYIFARAMMIVLFTTTNIYVISNELYVMAIFLSAGINIMWTLNIKDLAISHWKDRLAYIIGGVCGTIVSLYILRDLIKSVTI